VGFLTASNNLPFLVALALVFLLGVLEVVSLLIGGASSLFDGGSEIDVPSAETSALSLDNGDLNGDFNGASAEADVDSLPTQLLAWLHVGQIPSMILLIVFLLSFGAAGLALQTTLLSSLGVMLPASVAMIPAFIIALPGTRLLGGLLKPILPRDETEAVSRDSFLGCEAQITVGNARLGAPAEARVRDRYGRSHYILVEPDKDDAILRSGSHILILKRREAIYQGIEVMSAQLDD
jgi:hypothetical protein